MSVGPPLAASSTTFAYGVCKDILVYIKHKRKRVIDLVDDFVELRCAVDSLNACWKDNEEKIESQSWSIQKNNQFTALENKLFTLCSKFEKIKQKYTMYRKYLEIGNQSSRPAEASNGTNVDQAITNAPAREFAVPSKNGQQEISNGANVDQACTNAPAREFALPSKNGQQETSNGANVDQASTNAPAREFALPSNVGQQKIWTRKFFKLAQLDKDIVKLIPKINSVKNEIRFEDLISPVKPQVVVRMEADELKNIIPSHEKHLADLKEYLRGENCKRIGIYGAPGVGITNIMKNLNNCFHDCNFLGLDYVIWVAVPGESTKEEMIENIQEKILRRLRIDWQKYKNLSRADIISAELSKKKYLLLLDDFSSLMRLEEIGIREEHMHGKVVIAGKNSKTVRGVNWDSIEVKCLPCGDRSKLFNKFVEIDTLSVDLRKMVGPILKEVGGLPGVIRATAEYLKENREPRIWAGIKQRLQSNICTSRLLGLAGLNKVYELFYEELEENSFKKCLLYVALFPSGHKIPESTLVECWKAEQFLKCSLPTMDAARNEGAIVFAHLRRRYLLQRCCEEYVKMPEFFRKIALVLPFPEDADGALIVRLGPEINGHLEEREWKVARRVSLMGSNLKELPSSPQCDRISTLLLQLNPELIIIPDSFLRSVKTLRVLDLNGTGITLLPPSISNLTELRCLYLNNCGGLTNLPPEIVKLAELEVLDIRGTSIPFLPIEISGLISLRCLRISFVTEAWVSRSWVIFPPGIANKLRNLEELTILGMTGISEEIVNRIQTEVREFKGTKVFSDHPCIQRPFQSLDQGNLVQIREETNLPNPSVPENPGQDPTTEIQSPRFSNEGPSYGSAHSRADSNSQASKKDKGKGIAIPKPKNVADGIDKKIRELPETNARPIDIQGDDAPEQQIERASGDVVDWPNSSAGASTSGTAGRAD